LIVSSICMQMHSPKPAITHCTTPASHWHSTFCVCFFCCLFVRLVCCQKLRMSSKVHQRKAVTVEESQQEINPRAFACCRHNGCYQAVCAVCKTHARQNPCRKTYLCFQASGVSPANTDATTLRSYAPTGLLTMDI
jgi:hypothetical protein